jgi:hypothetical protein
VPSDQADAVCSLWAAVAANMSGAKHLQDYVDIKDSGHIYNHTREDEDLLIGIRNEM